MAGMSKDVSRSSYLLDGRRVTVRDLVDNGLLPAGTTLRFDRPRVGESHRATVTPDGHLELQDGLVVRSPSRAAAVAVNGGAFDGWFAWVVADTGDALDSLRAELLERVAHQPLPDGEERRAEGPDRHDWLKQARTKTDDKTPIALTVRELIGKWNAKSRGNRVIEWIEADLANHGLVTLPPFHTVTLDATVELVTPPPRPDAQATDSESEASANDAIHDLGLKVGNLPTARMDGLTSISPDATFDEAITTMLLNDYSQLPVLAGEHNLRGAVSWQSIARAQHAKPNAPFSAAIFDPPIVRYDEDLIDVLPLLSGPDFVLVKDEKKRIRGIVTTADVVQLYGQSATPFFLIGELDRILRNVMKEAFSLDEVNEICRPEGLSTLGSHDELTMGDYQRMLERPDNWGKLNWPLHRKHFVRRLDELREIRNDIMHFNLDIALDEDAVAKLRNMIRVLRAYGTRDDT